MLYEVITLLGGGCQGTARAALKGMVERVITSYSIHYTKLYESLDGDYRQTFYTGETYGTNDTTASMNLTQYLPTGGSLTASTLAGYTTPESDFPEDTWVV